MRARVGGAGNVCGAARALLSDGGEGGGARIGCVPAREPWLTGRTVAAVARREKTGTHKLGGGHAPKNTHTRAHPPGARLRRLLASTGLPTHPPSASHPRPVCLSLSHQQKKMSAASPAAPGAPPAPPPSAPLSTVNSDRGVWLLKVRGERNGAQARGGLSC